MRILIAAFVLAFGFASPALANGYIEGTAAYTDGNDLDIGGTNFSMESGYLIGLAIGGVLANQVSLEGEVTHSSRDVDGFNASLAATALMANAYFNFQIANSVGGYLGGGVGAVNVDVDDQFFSGSDTVLGYQFLLGLTYGMANGVTLFTEYRYQASNDADISGQDVEYNSHNIGGGVRVGF